MKKWFQFVSLLILAVFLLTPPLFAQDDEPTLPPVTDGEETTPAEPDTPASQEVEINEDNYRQFMELKDAMRQRDIIPENVFKPGSGLQKLDKLPEESQKHLRNQLREIIVQGDPWKPGDEETEYPYTPSVAASTNPSLEKQEKEAWGELVDSYHERESQMYENSSGSQATRGSEQGSSNSPENGTGSTGPAGQDGEGSQGQQPGQEGNPDQSDTEGTYSLNGSNDPNANSTAGVSQNAMEFLQGLGEGSGEQGSSTENGQGGESPTPSEGQSQAQAGQQGTSDQSGAASSGTLNSARDPNAKSTAGASQNAMEFLMGNAGQGEKAGESGTSSSEASTGQGETQEGEAGEALADGQQDGQEDGQPDGQNSGQDDGQTDSQADGHADVQGEGQAGSQDNGQSQNGEQTETAESSTPVVPPASTTPVSPAEAEEESTAGASQNALEYLKSGNVQTTDSTDNEPDSDQSEGTLTIQDLLNARGVGGSTGTAPATTSPEGEQQPDDDTPDKDGGGQ